VLPPADDTRNSPPTTVGANMMVPSLLQVPPAPMGAVANVCVMPPSMLMRFNLPSAKKPIALLSGDQNGLVARSVPFSGWAVAAESERTHNRDTPSSMAANTSFSPLGEIARDSGSGEGGVTMSRRISEGADAGLVALVNATPPMTRTVTASAAATAHPNRSRARDADCATGAGDGGSTVSSSSIKASVADMTQPPCLILLQATTEQRSEARAGLWWERRPIRLAADDRGEDIGDGWTAERLTRRE
jgi:hypothetical protein